MRAGSKRELTLRQIFEEAGCKGDRLTEQHVKGSQQPNVICTMPGASGSAIVVGGRFAARPRRHPFVFVGFTDEESGLITDQVVDFPTAPRAGRARPLQEWSINACSPQIRCAL